MPKNSSCALIGPGQGPLIRVRSRGVVKVRGLPKGEKAHAFPERTKAPIELAENGEHPFEECDYLFVKYDGAAKGFIALVITEG